jgi:GGDEF domain-containing protein
MNLLQFYLATHDVLTELPTQAAVGEEGIVARLGGKNLAVLLPNVSDPPELEAVSGAIEAVIKSPVGLGWVRLPLSVRVGRALVPDDSGLPDALLTMAHQRMESCKRDEAPSPSRVGA